MVFEIRRCSADTDGFNDCVPARTYVMSSISFLICSVLLRSLLTDLRIDQGPPLQRTFQSAKCSSEETRREEKGGFHRISEGRYTIVSCAEAVFFFFLKSNTTSLGIYLLIGHYSSSDSTVKRVWKAGERLWVYQAPCGDTTNNSTNQGCYINPTPPLWSQKY